CARLRTVEFYYYAMDYW
nr:immunoglobulin heavy chain junction region [Mus musculus]